MPSETIKHGLADATMATGHAHARREPRFELTFEVELCGFGPDSQSFKTRTSTLDVSEWGCRFEVPFRMEPNSVFTLQCLTDDKGSPADCAPVMFQVVRATQSGRGWGIAAWKIASEKVWPVDLPIAAPEDPDERTVGMRRDGAE